MEEPWWIFVFEFPQQPCWIFAFVVLSHSSSRILPFAEWHPMFVTSITSLSSLLHGKTTLLSPPCSLFVYLHLEWSSFLRSWFLTIQLAFLFWNPLRLIIGLMRVGYTLRAYCIPCTLCLARFSFLVFEIIWLWYESTGNHLNCLVLNCQVEIHFSSKNPWVSTALWVIRGVGSM